MRLGEATMTSCREINETDRAAGSGAPAGPGLRPSDTNPEREREEGHFHPDFLWIRNHVLHDSHTRGDASKKNTLSAAK